MTATPAERLATERSATLEQVDALSRAHHDIIDAATGVATDDEHDPEGATIAFERAQLAALLDGARQRLAALDRATQRLAEGTYGACLGCGGPIAAERLAVRPAAETCIMCASRRR